MGASYGTDMSVRPVKEWITKSMLWLVSLLMRLISMRVCWALGSGIGFLAYYVSRERRDILHKNLGVVAAYKEDIAATLPSARAIFQRSMANIVCSMKAYTMSPQNVAKHVDIQCDERFHELMASDQGGAILCAAHMGNWELLTNLKTFVEFGDHELGAVFRPLSNSAANQHVEESRGKDSCRLFAKGSSLNELAKFIRTGGVLGILADQKTGNKLKGCEFFGMQTGRNRLPIVLSRRADAPLFSISVYSNNPGHWCVEIKNISMESADGDSLKMLHLLTARYEEIFTEHLIDVFWLHRYWRKL